MILRGNLAIQNPNYVSTKLTITLNCGSQIDLIHCNDLKMLRDGAPLTQSGTLVPKSLKQAIVDQIWQPLQRTAFSSLAALQNLYCNSVGPSYHVAALLFSGSVPLLTLLVNCFPDQSRGVFQELKGRSQLNVIGGARVLAPASRSRRKTLLSAP